MQIPTPALPSHVIHSPGAVFLSMLETSLGTIGWGGGKDSSLPAEVMKKQVGKLGKKSVSFALGSESSRQLAWQSGL